MPTIDIHTCLNLKYSDNYHLLHDATKNLITLNPFQSGTAYYFRQF